MKTIIEHIKNNNFKNLYLISGEEKYLKRQYKLKLRECIVGLSDTMNYSYFEGNVNVKEVISICDTMPFFADRRLIIIENSGMFKKANDEMSEYLKNIPESTYIVFIEDEIDKRNKMYKYVTKEGVAASCDKLNEQKLMEWTLRAITREKKKITKETMQLFLSKAGDELENISSELEKLLCYVNDREVITSLDVEEICTERTSNRIFDMINLIADKRQKEALTLYYDLLALKEPPMRILFLVVRQFNIILQIKEMQRLRKPQDAISKAVGLPSFVVGKYKKQVERFEREELIDILNKCAITEESVKTGRLNDVIGIEMLIVEFSKK